MTAERYDAFVSYGHGDADTELWAEDFDRASGATHLIDGALNA